MNDRFEKNGTKSRRIISRRIEPKYDYDVRNDSESNENEKLGVVITSQTC